jgi:expansin (peptidoglycan-binding protein)
VVVRLVDRCPECMIGDVDATRSVFTQVVGDLSIGRHKIVWRLV